MEGLEQTLLVGSETSWLQTALQWLDIVRQVARHEVIQAHHSVMPWFGWIFLIMLVLTAIFGIPWIVKKLMKLHRRAREMKETALRQLTFGDDVFSDGSGVQGGESFMAAPPGFQPPPNDR